MNNIIVTSDYINLRLDKYLTSQLSELSRSRIQQLIEQGCVNCADNVMQDAAYKVKLGEEYFVNIPTPETSFINPTQAELDIIFEDEHLLVINKAAGMTVHPAPGHRDDTLVNALLAYCADSLSGIGGVMRPGIVHRIDKDTSGLLVVAKHDVAHRHLSEQLADRSLKRQYIAVVKGVPKPLTGKIEGNIGRSPRNRQKMAVLKSGGKTAITHYKTEEVFEKASLIACNLETGRTHQIRVHFAHIGCPLIGDPLYGRTIKTEFNRQALHAAKLTLIHPITEKQMEFSAPLSPDISELIEVLRNN